MRKIKIYQKNGCWVLVKKSTGGYFRASTNNEEVYWLIVRELPWRRVRDEAQADLDKFAVTHDLEVVDEEAQHLGESQRRKLSD